jgi:predicted amidohydrolase YtcJ
MISCREQVRTDVELIVHNADLYTMDPAMPRAQAIAVAKGKIVYVGDSKAALKLKNPDTKVVDAHGQFVMPGLIEAHGHFSAFGNSLMNLNLLNSRSWSEIIDSTKARASITPKGQWIEGGGWHQEKWNKKETSFVEGYPFHKAMSDSTAEHPVILYHASRHALFANKKAMEIAQVNAATKDPVGGRILRNAKNEPTGIFEENAMSLITDVYDKYKNELPQHVKQANWQAAIEKAQQECLKNGITSFQDAGSSFEELKRYESLALQNKLDVRLWVMARHSYDQLKDKISRYKKIGVGNNFYTCNAIKSQVDGALGSFGAWLLKPYNDKPGFVGQNTTNMYEVKNIGELAIKNGMQYCVHAIGDRANKTVLDIYEGLANKYPDQKDLRWRIEHAQHVDPIDFKRFAQYGIIASIQGIHCTSDAPFVVKRLGVERAQFGAYAWRSFLRNKVQIANGTDVPIESIDPMQNIYALVTRKKPSESNGFFPEQRLTRFEALRSYTMDNAYAAKEEHIKGSLTVGKVGDLIILSKNLFKCRDSEIPETKVVLAIVNGEIKTIL